MKEILVARGERGGGGETRQWIGIDSPRDLVPNNSDWRLRDRSMHRRPTLVKYFKIVADLRLIFWLVSTCESTSEARGSIRTCTSSHFFRSFERHVARSMIVILRLINYFIRKILRNTAVKRLAATFDTLQARIESTYRWITLKRDNFDSNRIVL